MAGEELLPVVRPMSCFERPADLRDGIETRALVVRLDRRGARGVPVDEQRRHQRGFVSRELVPLAKQRQHQLVVVLDAAAQFSLVDQPRDQGRHFGGARPVVPRRADHLGREGQEMLVQPTPIDRRGIGQRREPPDRRLTPPELAAKERRRSEQQAEQGDAKPRGSAEGDTRRQRGVSPPQASCDRDVLSARRVRPREARRNLLPVKPDRIERQIDRQRVDRPLEIGQAEVVIEQVSAVFRDQDVREGVVENVGNLAASKRGIEGRRLLHRSVFESVQP